MTLRKTYVLHYCMHWNGKCKGMQNKNIHIWHQHIPFVLTKIMHIYISCFYSQTKKKIYLSIIISTWSFTPSLSRRTLRVIWRFHILWEQHRHSVFNYNSLEIQDMMLQMMVISDDWLSSQIVTLLWGSFELCECIEKWMNERNREVEYSQYLRVYFC